MRKTFASVLLLLAGCSEPEARVEQIQVRVSKLALSRLAASKPPALSALVELKFPKRSRAARAPVECTLTGPGGSHMIHEKPELPANETTLRWSVAFPPPAQGWKPGRYEIACTANGNSGRYSFDVGGEATAEASATSTATPSFTMILTPRIYSTDEPHGDPIREGDEFDAASLKYITFEVPMPTLPVSYSLKGCVVERTLTGVAQFPNTVTEVVQTKPITTRFVGSVGYGVPGQWLPGEYEVSCGTENVEVRPRRFRVTGPPAPNLTAALLGNRLPIPKAKAASIRLLEHGGQMPEWDKREYGGHFVGASRYIATEVKVALEPAPNVQPFKFRCHYFNAGGQVIGHHTVNLQIPAGSKDHFMWIWWGSADGRYWNNGDYFVECDSEDFFVASRWFRIER